MFLLLRQNSLSRGIIRPCSIFPPTTTLMVGSNEGVYNCTLHIVPQLPHWWHAQRCLRIRVIGEHISITDDKGKEIAEERKTKCWLETNVLVGSEILCCRLFSRCWVEIFLCLWWYDKNIVDKGREICLKNNRNTRVCKNEDCFLSRPCWERRDGWQHLPVFVCANAKVAWHQQQNFLPIQKIKFEN